MSRSETGIRSRPATQDGLPSLGIRRDRGERLSEPFVLGVLKKRHESPGAKSRALFGVAADSPGAGSIRYRLWILRLQPFEDGFQRLDLRRQRLRLEIDEPAQRRHQDRPFVIGKI
jgi:hypothetical protein